jgi:effector-binding domain-containing protein
MKVLKYLFFLILICLIGGAIFFGTKDGKFEVSETKIVNAPAELIYDQVKDFKNWENWGPWLQIDPNIKISKSEKTDGEGSTYSWKSNHEALGNVSIETKKVIPLKEIDQELVIETLLGVSKSDVYWRFENTETPGQTKVTWGVKGDPTFLEKVMMAFREHDIGTGVGILFPLGLANLDSLVINEMNKYIIHVDGVTNYQGGYYLYNAAASKISEIGTKMGVMFGEVTEFMSYNKIEHNGMPFTIYNQMDEMNNSTIFSACIPVAERLITPKDSPVLCGYMEPVTALKTTLKGDYQYLGEAYAKANEYIAANNLNVDPAAKMFEIYRNDPGMEPNPANWLTEIYIPLAVSPKPGN